MLISSTAVTEITFGGIPSTALASRTPLVLDPSYTINASYALPSTTTLYSAAPYLTVSADKASFVANVTLSGYLSYNWGASSFSELYFDIDAGFTADLELSVDVGAAYTTTFSYIPATLSYSLVSVPGIIEIAPELSFGVSALVGASAAVGITAEGTIGLADGNVHLDVLNSNLTGTSGWNPTYTVSADLSGDVVATINPTAALTVELEVSLFSGLIDLSTG
jgi:hypothetical protein